jgi:phospho-N-acetylmuramoyl-pentapeptide-transferase
MLFILAERLAVLWPALRNVHQLDGITPRAALAAAATFVVALAGGPLCIAWLAARFREPTKSASAEIARLHAAKHSTPTMGGVFIVGGLVAGTLAFGNWTNPYLPIAVATTVALALVGACDDWIKLRTARRGLSARGKLAAQSAVALAAALAVYRAHAMLDHGLPLSLPFCTPLELGWTFVPLAALVIVASSNAVNLTDGLDGLAGGCLVCAAAALAVVAYAAGHAQWAPYFGIPHISGAGEMAVVAAALIGGLLAFLWFNCHPASVFMGNAGSLPLGGLLGLMAAIARQELLLVVIGGVFVVEAASVIVQVAVFRATRRRVLRCAPVHHHFQLKGWPEDKIVVRFWIAGALCAIAGLAGLQLQSRPLSPFAKSTMPSRTLRGGGQETAVFAELSGGAACPINTLPHLGDAPRATAAARPTLSP